MHELIIRQRNINWQDWKHKSFVLFVGYSHNIRRHNAMCRDELVADVVENIGLKLQCSSWLSIHLLLHRLYRFYHQINSIYKCAIIGYNVLHGSVSYWESLSCKIFLYSLRKHKLIETQLWKGISIQCFRQRQQQVSLRPWHRMFWLWQMKITNVFMYRCIFPILPVNVPCSYISRT